MASVGLMWSADEQLRGTSLEDQLFLEPLLLPVLRLLKLEHRSMKW